MLAGAAVLSGVGYLLTAYTVSRWLTRPSRGVPRPTPTEAGLEWEHAECQTMDGHRLARIEHCLRENAKHLTDAGLLSTEKTPDAVPGVFWGGLRLLRFTRCPHL